MKRLNNSDANITLDSRTINIADFTARFYTVNAEEFYIEKTQSDVVFDGENATIKLDWRELVTLGEGVLQYQIINNIEDTDRADNTYNKNVERTTEYYINSNIIYEDSQSKSYAEMIERIGADLDAEITRSTTEDVTVNNKLNNEITRATARENTITQNLNNIAQSLNNYIPTSEKGANNGVATLNSSGLIPQNQLQFPTRGAINPSSIDDVNLDNGVYQINGKVISQDILSGETANGIFVNYPYGSKVQVLYVGRAADAAMGEQVEIYTRRYLSTPKRWTAWNHLTQQDQYTLEKSGSNIQLKKNGVLVTQVTDSNTTYSNMSQTEATNGTASTARLISSKVLNTTIDNKIANKADYAQTEELVISATTELILSATTVANNQVEVQQGTFNEIRNAVQNGRPTSKIKIVLDGTNYFTLSVYNDSYCSFTSMSGEESFIEEIQISDLDNVDYFFRQIPYITEMTQAQASNGTSIGQMSISPKILVDTIKEKADTFVVNASGGLNNLTFDKSFADVLEAVQTKGAEKVFLYWVNSKQLFSIEYIANVVGIYFKSSDIEGGQLLAICYNSDNTYDVFEQHLFYETLKDEEIRLGRNTTPKLATAKDVNGAVNKLVDNYYSGKHLVLHASDTGGNGIVFEETNYYDLISDFAANNLNDSIDNVKILFNNSYLLSLTSFYIDDVGLNTSMFSFSCFEPETKWTFGITVYSNQDPDYFEFVTYQQESYKATSGDLSWAGTWVEGGDGDLTRIELLRKGNVVYLSGCVKNPNSSAVVGKIFTIPARFRPSRKISWAQMGQQWFQVDGVNKAVSYFCQINPDGTFGLDKLNCGGTQITYQADKNLFVNGMWMID